MLSIICIFLVECECIYIADNLSLKLTINLYIVDVSSAYLTRLSAAARTTDDSHPAQNGCADATPREDTPLLENRRQRDENELDRIKTERKEQILSVLVCVLYSIEE